MTLIVLGESIAAATVAVETALASGEALSDLIPLIVGGLLIVYSLWWFYFDRPVHDLLTSFRKAITWGYGHYLVFASAGAVGAGLAVAVDQVTHHARITRAAAGAAVAIPVAVFVTCLWLLHDRPDYARTRAFGPIAAFLVLLTPLTGSAVQRRHPRQRRRDQADHAGSRGLVRGGLSEGRSASGPGRDRVRARGPVDDDVRTEVGYARSLA